MRSSWGVRGERTATVRTPPGAVIGSAYPSSRGRLPMYASPMSDTVHHPVFARLYAWLSPHGERTAIADHRREALAGLRGRVLEVGAGNGLNFAHYPGTVTEVLAVEPERYLRGRAERAAA